MIHFREALAIAGAPGRRARPRARRTSARWASGRWPSTAATSSSSRATRRRSGRSTATPSPTTRTGHSFDLIFRGIELVTGGQRLHRYDDYDARDPSARRGPDAPYASYLEAFRHGMPPHGGFAIGLERWVGRLAGGPEHPRGHAVPPRPAPAAPREEPSTWPTPIAVYIKRVIRMISVSLRPCCVTPTTARVGDDWLLHGTDVETVWDGPVPHRTPTDRFYVRNHTEAPDIDPRGVAAAGLRGRRDPRASPTRSPTCGASPARRTSARWSAPATGAASSTTQQGTPRPGPSGATARSVSRGGAGCR